MILAQLQKPDGTLVLPLLARLIPMIAKLAARADVGDEEADEAMRQLVDGVLFLHEVGGA